MASPRQNGGSENGGSGHDQSMVFRGCSSIRDYEIMGKLGEGTFGFVYPLVLMHALIEEYNTERFTARNPERLVL